MKNSHSSPAWSFAVGFLVIFSLCLGLPLFHYVTAFMIALILQNREHPEQVDLLGISRALRRRRNPVRAAEASGARL